MLPTARLKVALLLGAAAIPPMAAPVSAQQLEEIIVTAQKREQAATDVPIALSAYSGQFLEDLGLRELDEVSDFVPGLQVQLQSPNNPGLVIRGITSDDGAANQEARVSVFIDGVPASRARGAVSELFDLERIEVLKGPQGTLFGRGAQIGAVSIITAKPQLDEVEVKGRVSVGNYNSREYEAAVNVPVSDTAAFRIAGLHRNREGYIDNLAGGDALNGAKVQAIRGSVLLVPTERLTLTGVLNYQEDDYTGTSFKSGTYAPPGGDTRPTTAAALNRGDALGVDRSTFNVTVQGEYEVTDTLTLTSITGYREFNSFEEFDADGTAAFVLEFAEDAQGEQFTQEIRANFSIGDRFEGFVGGSYFWEDGFQRVPFQTDERSLFALFSPFLAGVGIPTIPLIGPNGRPVTTFPPQLGGGVINPVASALAGRPVPFKTLHREEQTNFGETTAYEVFADGTYAITDSLDLTLGARLTYEDVEAGLETIGDTTPGTLGFILGVSPNNLFAPTNGRVTASDEFTSVVGRAVLSYEFGDSGLAYASVSRGRRPNVINVAEDPADTEVLRNEIVWSYETGAKTSLLDDRLSLEGAVFYYDYANFQTDVTEIDPNGGGLIAETRDSGEAGALGFEVSFTAKASQWATLFGSYSYIDAEFADEDSDGNPQELAGNTFRLTPKHSFALGGRFTAPVGQGVEAFFTPTYTYKSRVFFEEANDPGIEQEGYGLLNLRVGLAGGDGRWTVTGFVSNALDKDYIIDAGNTGGAFGIPTFIAGPPRFYGIEASFRF